MTRKSKPSLNIIFAISCFIALLPSDADARPDGRALRPDPIAYVSPSRDLDVIHTRLDLDLDLERQTVRGTVTHTLRALKSNVQTIRLNAVRLDIEEVYVDGRPADFDYPVQAEHATSWIEAVESRESSEELVIYSHEPLPSDGEFDITVKYRGEPKEGLYFIRPEKGIPEKRYEVWSQGEGEDNRYWIPCFDYPNDKATFEGIFRVKKGYYVLSNGVLIDSTDIENQTQYHWRLDTPQVSYLIMVAAAEYDIVEEKWRDIPLMYVVPPGTDRETVRRGYGLTADMMEFLSTYIGIDYPFKKYAQVVVQNFIYGGMENTSATVMNTRTLYDESMALTYTQQGLVAHELAHQWWGDMVTCAEWSHMWLNEGFASYFQSLYREHRDGDDALRYQMDERHTKLAGREDADPRPVVVDFFNRKDSRNSANVYIKGASVLHMLRFYLGDELFRKCIQVYGERYKYGLAETSDFVRTVKQTSGENLDWFFEQWLYLTGHPKLKVTQTWETETNTFKLNIRQTQSIENLTPVFRLPMDLEITCEETTATYRIVVDKTSQDFYFDLPSKPLMVIVDKGDWTMKTLEFSKSNKELLYQLRHGDTMSRIRAARDMTKRTGDARVVDALATILFGEDFWGLRREAALALGKIGGEAAQAALLGGLEVEDGRVRLAVVEAMGDLESGNGVDNALLDRFRKDPAHEVRAQAVKSLTKLQSDRAKKICHEALKTDSDREVVRSAGLEGLVKLKSTSSIGKVKALAGPGNRRTFRHTAITSYAKLAKALESERDRADAADFLTGMLDDWYLRTRSTVISALGTLGEPSAVDALRGTAQSDPVESIRRRALRTATSIESKKEKVAKNESLEEEIKTLTEKIEALRAELNALKAKVPERRTGSGQVSTEGGSQQ